MRGIPLPRQWQVQHNAACGQPLGNLHLSFLFFRRSIQCFHRRRAHHFRYANTHSSRPMIRTQTNPVPMIVRSALFPSRRSQLLTAVLDVYFERSTADFSTDAVARSTAAKLKLESYYKVAVDSAIERNAR